MLVRGGKSAEVSRVVTDWYPVEIPTLNHILGERRDADPQRKQTASKRRRVRTNWGSGGCGRSFTESIFNHSVT